MKIESEFDFGFEIVDEVDVNKEVVAAAQSETIRYAEEAQRLRDMILPLLHNLSKKPESEYIRWPNRTKTINEFIHKMYAVSGLVPSDEDLV